MTRNNDMNSATRGFMLLQLTPLFSLRRRWRAGKTRIIRNRFGPSSPCPSAVVIDLDLEMRRPPIAEAAPAQRSTPTLITDRSGVQGRWGGSSSMSTATRVLSNDSTLALCLGDKHYAALCCIMLPGLFCFPLCFGMVLAL